MGYVKVRARKTTCTALKKYLEKNDRAEEISTFNCSENHWDKDMQETKETYDKTEGNQLFHIMQSFENEPDNPNYNADEVHQAGKDFAKKYAALGYEVVVVTHNDTDNLHNHIVINSVNSETGEKLDIWKAEKKEIRDRNDEICKEHGLRTLKESTREKYKQEREERRLPQRMNNRQYWENVRTEEGAKPTERQEKENRLREKMDKFSKNAKSDKDMEKYGIEISKEYNNGVITYMDKDTGYKMKGKYFGDLNREELNNLYERNIELEREQEIERERDREQESSRDHSRYDRGDYGR